jgi:hypothetical protein
MIMIYHHDDAVARPSIVAKGWLESGQPECPCRLCHRPRLQLAEMGSRQGAGSLQRREPCTSFGQEGQEKPGCWNTLFRVFGLRCAFSSLSSYAVRADPATTRGRTPRGRLLMRHCSASRLPISAIDGRTICWCSIICWLQIRVARTSLKANP